MTGIFQEITKLRKFVIFLLALFSASLASAQPAVVVNVYSGPGGGIIYLDAPFDPATDKLLSLLPVPYNEQPVRRLYTAPTDYNNQPDGEGSDQQASVIKAPIVLPGGYAIRGAPAGAISVERAGVRSQAYFWQRPKIYGLWGRTTYPGSQIRFWGHWAGGRHHVGGKAHIYLVDEAGTMHRCQQAGTWREMETDETSLVSMSVPADLALGKYLLRVHSTYGWQWGWSNDEAIEIIAPPVRTAVVKTVSPALDGASSWTAINTAVQAAGPGGTVDLLPGRYVLDKRLDLLAAQTIRGTGATLTGAPLFVRDDCTVIGISFTGAVQDHPIAGGAVRVVIDHCQFETLNLETFKGRQWTIIECDFLRSGIFYGDETFIKGCRFRDVGWHHACITWGSRDSVISENTIDGCDRGFVQMFHWSSVAGNFWYRNEIENVGQVPNGCEHFLCEGVKGTATRLVTHSDGATYKVDQPITSSFTTPTPYYAVRDFDGHTTEAIRVEEFIADANGDKTQFRLARPFRSKRNDVPVQLAYGFFDNTIMKMRMRNGLGAAVNIFGTRTHNNRFVNLVSVGPMSVKVFGLSNSQPTTGLSFTDCELHGGRIHFSGPARYNVLDGVVVTDPLVSGTNQFSYTVAERDIALPAMESKGTGNAILRAAVVRPGGMAVSEGFEVVIDLKVVGQ